MLGCGILAGQIKADIITRGNLLEPDVHEAHEIETAENAGQRAQCVFARGVVHLKTTLTQQRNLKRYGLYLLLRLGLETFGQVAAVGEGALFYQFGKIGRLLYRRSLGEDLEPIRALWPPIRSDTILNLDEFPITQRDQVEYALTRVSQQAEADLRALGRHGRRVVLRVTTEADQYRREWMLPAPIQSAAQVRSAAARLLSQMKLSAPITELRLLVEGLETPAARTNDLFVRGPGDDPAVLEAVRRSLQARFGKNGVFVLGQRPRSAREDRRACLHEKWQTHH